MTNNSVSFSNGMDRPKVQTSLDVLAALLPEQAPGVAHIVLRYPKEAKGLKHRTPLLRGMNNPGHPWGILKGLRRVPNPIPHSQHQ